MLRLGVLLPRVLKDATEVSESKVPKSQFSAQKMQLGTFGPIKKGANGSLISSY